MLLSHKLIVYMLVATVVVCFTSLSSAASIYDDAVAYWPFEETSGTTVNDASLTTAIDLDFQGNLNRVPGAVGNGIQADDEGSHNLLTTNGDVDALDLSIGEEFTIASWVFNPNYFAIASKMESSGNYRGWWFSTLVNGLTFTLRSQNVDGERIQVKSDPLPTGEWVHAAVTFSYDALDDLRGVRFYVNGQSVDAYLDASWGAITGPTDNDRSFNIFGRNDLGFPQRSNAIVDELAIWKRVLTATEIEEVYSLGIPFSGDANRDGMVDNEDTAVLASNWLTTGVSWDDGDFNDDDIVDDIDATILAANYGYGVSSTAVPEPAISVLLTGGLLLVMASFVNPRSRIITNGKG